IAALLGGGIHFWICRARLAVMRVYERGVALVVEGEEQLLPFEQMGQVIWKLKKELSFIPLPGVDAPTIRCFLVGGEERDLGALRDTAARVIAGRMALRLQQGEAVPWTEQLRFLPEGLECTSDKRRCAGQPVTVPYSQVD